MRGRYLVAVLVFVLGVGGFLRHSAMHAPWWRVSVITKVPGVFVWVSKWRLAEALTQLGVWEKGFVVPGMGNKGVRWVVPKRVEVWVGEQTYPKHQFIGNNPGDILYSALVEMKEDGTFWIRVGLPNIRYFGKPELITTVTNEGLLTTIFSWARITTSGPQFDVDYREKVMPIARLVGQIVRIYGK